MQRGLGGAPLDNRTRQTEPHALMNRPNDDRRLEVHDLVHARMLHTPRHPARATHGQDAISSASARTLGLLFLCSPNRFALAPPLTSSTSGRGETRYAQRKMQSCLHLPRPSPDIKACLAVSPSPYSPLAKLHRMLSLALFSLGAWGGSLPSNAPVSAILLLMRTFPHLHRLLYCTSCLLPRNSHSRWSTSALLDRAPAHRISMPPFNGGAGLLHNWTSSYIGLGLVVWETALPPLAFQGLLLPF